MAPGVERRIGDKPRDRKAVSAAAPRWIRRGAPKARGLARLLTLILAGLAAAPPNGRADTVPFVTGLPVPRFASLKTDNVDVHAGPGKDLSVTWMFQRAGLPVEITAEFGSWRKIRDFDGAEGWVLHSLLSARRTSLVVPWKKDLTLQLYRQADAASEVVALLQPGVLGNIVSCSGTWCHIFGTGFDGWLPQNDLWGVYPGERVN